MHLFGNNVVKIAVKPNGKNPLEIGDGHDEFVFVEAEETVTKQIDAETMRAVEAEFLKIYEAQRAKIKKIFFDKLTLARLDKFLSDEILSNSKCLKNFGFSSTDINLPSYFGGRVANLSIKASEMPRVLVLTDLAGIDIEQDNNELAKLDAFIKRHSSTLKSVRIKDCVKNGVKKIFELVSKHNMSLPHIHVFENNNYENQIKILNDDKGYKINISSAYRELLTAEQKNACHSLEYIKTDEGNMTYDYTLDAETFLEPIFNGFPKVTTLIICVERKLLYKSIIASDITAKKLPNALKGTFLIVNTTSNKDYDSNGNQVSYIHLAENGGSICVHADTNIVSKLLIDEWSKKPRINLDIVGASLEGMSNKDLYINALTTTEARDITITDNGSVSACFVKSFEDTPKAPIKFPEKIEKLKITIKDVANANDIGKLLMKLRVPSKTLKLVLLGGVKIKAEQLKNLGPTAKYGDWSDEEGTTLTCEAPTHRMEE